MKEGEDAAVGEEKARVARGEGINQETRQGPTPPGVRGVGGAADEIRQEKDPRPDRGASRRPPRLIV